MDALAHKFTNWAFDWVISFGPRIILAVVIFFIGEWLVKLLNRWFKKILSGKRFDNTLRPFLQNLLQVILQVLLILGLMQILGIQMTVFAAVIGAFGVAIGFALSGTLQNFASGVLIIALKPFKVGDNINTQGQEGTVTSIRLFYTVVVTFNNTTVIVPNSKLSNEIIFNLTKQPKRRMDVEMKFNYGIEFDTVKAIVLKSIDAFDSCLKDPPLRVGVQNLESDSYVVTINAWTNAHGFQDTRLAFQEKLMKDIKSAGIKLPGMS